MKRIGLIISVCVFVGCGVGLAHWSEGEPYKMHWPQLPDSTGWDIDMTNYLLADDWKCTETGDVKDIHFWYSVYEDMGIHQPPHFSSVYVAIYDNIPAGVGGADYSMPGNLLWERNFVVRDDMIAGPFSGVQGWDDPGPYGIKPCEPDNHNRYWQLNITDIIEPFRQVEGEIYWLALNVQLEPDNPPVGWKTTQNIYEDYAVYMLPDGGGWTPVLVCSDDNHTDFAFVITPEPMTLVLLGVGLLGLARRRK